MMTVNSLAMLATSFQSELEQALMVQPFASSPNLSRSSGGAAEEQVEVLEVFGLALLEEVDQVYLAQVGEGGAPGGLVREEGIVGRAAALRRGEQGPHVVGVAPIDKIISR